jgi:hypothetical protein
MGVFHCNNELLVRTRDGHNVQLEENLIYRTDELVLLRMPKGSRSDGASTPRSVWALIPPFGDWWLPSILHDGGYHGVLEKFENGVWVPANLTREQTDWLYFEAMTSTQTDSATKRIIYTAVVAAGGSSFHGYVAPA